MTDPISRTQQENAALDAASIERFVNGEADEIVTTRLGREIRTIAGLGLADGAVPLVGDATVTGLKTFKQGLRGLALQTASYKIVRFFMDSTGMGVDATGDGDGYHAESVMATLVQTRLNLLCDNHSEAGRQLADIVNVFFQTINPGYSQSELLAIGGGINDVIFQPSDDYQTEVFEPELWAALAFNTPSGFKQVAQNASASSGTWANEDSEITAGVAKKSTTNGSSLTFSATSAYDTGFLLFKVYDGKGGTFTWENLTTGSSPVTVNCFTTPPVDTDAGSVSVPIAIEIPLQVGANQIKVTVTSATNVNNPVTIIGLCLRPNIWGYQPPTSLVLGVSKKKGDASAALVLAYDTIKRNAAAKFSGYGYPVFFCDLHGELTDADMQEGPDGRVHYNEAGYEHVADMIVRDSQAIRNGDGSSLSMRIGVSGSPPANGLSVQGQTMLSTAFFHPGPTDLNWIQGQSGTGEIGGQATNDVISAYVNRKDIAARHIFDGGPVSIGSSAPVSGAQLDVAGHIKPHTDANCDIGDGTHRINNSYFAVASTVGSGRATKTKIEPITGDLLKVAKALPGLVRRYKIKTAEDEKGEAARWHIGFIFEDVVDLFASKGLDAFAYGIACRDPVMIEKVVGKKPVTRAKMVAKPRSVPKVKVVEGVAILTERLVERDPGGNLFMEPVFTYHPVVRYAPDDTERAFPIPVLDAQQRPVIHAEPVMEEVEEDVIELVQDTNADGSLKWIVSLRYQELDELITAGRAS